MKEIMKLMNVVYFSIASVMCVLGGFLGGYWAYIGAIALIIGLGIYAWRKWVTQPGWLPENKNIGGEDSYYRKD